MWQRFDSLNQSNQVSLVWHLPALVRYLAPWPKVVSALTQHHYVGHDKVYPYFFTLFACVPYSACNISFVASGVGPIGFSHPGSNTFPFCINVLMSPPHSIFVLKYVVITLRHSKNGTPLFPSFQPNFTYIIFRASLVTTNVFLQTAFPLANPLHFLFAPSGAFSLVLTLTFPIFSGVQLVL